MGWIVSYWRFEVLDLRLIQYQKVFLKDYFNHAMLTYLIIFYG